MAATATGELTMGREELRTLFISVAIMGPLCKEREARATRGKGGAAWGKKAVNRGGERIPGEQRCMGVRSPRRKQWH